MRSRLVVISGCSGGGKSALLGELRRRGHAVVPEPGRRVVEAELSRSGAALPWTDMAAFARSALEMAWGDLETVRGAQGLVFFDRGVVDAASALEHVTGEPVVKPLTGRLPYHSLVFLAPPWPEIYVNDEARRHGLAIATAEYERLAAAYPKLGFRVHVLPKVSIDERADYVLAKLG